MLAELSLTTTSQIRKLNTKAHLFCFSQTCVFCFQVVEASAGASALPIPSWGGGAGGLGGKTTKGPAHTSPPHTAGARQRAPRALVGKHQVLNFTSYLPSQRDRAQVGDGGCQPPVLFSAPNSTRF